MLGAIPRAAVIAVEGVDRCGKTTGIGMACEELQRKGYIAERVSFPARATQIGSILDTYLRQQNTSSLTDEATKLLFSANRWELQPRLKELITNADFLFIDRYYWSGMVYASLNDRMSREWLVTTEIGLVRPDVTLFLDVHPRALAVRFAPREGYPVEVFDAPPLQEKLYDQYSKLVVPSWCRINADNSAERVAHKIVQMALDVRRGVRYDPLDYVTLNDFGNFLSI